MNEDCAQFSVATPYSISKYLGERYCYYYHRYCGLPVAIVRYFNSYGPHEYPGPYRNVIPNFFATALAGKPLPVHGDGNATRDFTYVEDTAEGTCLAAVRDAALGEIINIGTGKEITILELATLINKITGNRSGIEHRNARSWDLVRRRHASVAKATRLLGFTARWSLEDGLAKTYHWFKSAVPAA